MPEMSRDQSGYGVVNKQIMFLQKKITIFAENGGAMITEY